MYTRRNLAFFCIALAAASIFAYARQESPATPSLAAAPAAAENASFKIGDIIYSFTVEKGETVLDAMRALEASSSFTFTGREYPGLGFFVVSIDGRANGGGKYWILYANGVLSAVGVSEAPVRAGDAFEWRYEKGY